MLKITMLLVDTLVIIRGAHAHYPGEKEQRFSSGGKSTV